MSLYLLFTEKNLSVKLLSAVFFNFEEKSSHLLSDPKEYEYEVEHHRPEGRHQLSTENGEGRRHQFGRQPQHLIARFVV